MEALGPVLIVLSIPLLFRWIPRNPIYGFRIAATLKDESVWYDANALFARHILLLGLVMVGLELVLPIDFRVFVLALIGGIGVITISVVDARTASRWARERESRRPPQ